MSRLSLAPILRGALYTATAASIGYQVAAVLAARRWRRRSPLAEEEIGAPIPVSVLKPVRGLEPHAERSFASFCLQEYPDFEVLFGAADPADPAVAAVQALAKRYPAANVRLVHTASDLGPNRKVCNLHGLAAAARHDLLVLTDSDMRVRPDYLRRITAPFRDPSVGLVTCPYRGADALGVAAALEALGIAAGFMPGVFVASLGASPFAFGSTIALRRETLQRIGGFEGLVDYLADDFQMGKRVSDLGLRIHLSSVVVDSVLGRRSFRESWTRRVRWARTVRACRPLGHLGSLLTQTTILALLTLAAAENERQKAKGKRQKAKVKGGLTPASGHPSPARTAGEGPSKHHGSPQAPLQPPLMERGAEGGVRRPFPLAFCLASLTLTVRLWSAWRIAVVELESEVARRWFPLLLVSDLVDAALWVSSFLGRDVTWRGQRYRLLEGGKIERAE